MVALASQEHEIAKLIQVKMNIARFGRGMVGGGT